MYCYCFLVVSKIEFYFGFVFLKQIYFYYSYIEGSEIVYVIIAQRIVIVIII